MKRIFLLGFPVSHSISPAMQNAALHHLGMDWRYELLDTPFDRLRNVVARLRQDDCAGANVTIPHKQTVMKWLDEISEHAQKIGAVNTIVKRDGKLIGDNTDAYGVLQSFADENILLRNARVVIFGAGGGAFGTAHALCELGVSRIAILNRTQTRAETLGAWVRQHFPQVAVTINHVESIHKAHLLINATSVGMMPHTDASPVPQGIAFPHHVIALDLVYRPLQTKFLRDAKLAGARTISGLGMLVHQGALALKLWTEHDAPVQVMFDAARQELHAMHVAQARNARRFSDKGVECCDF